MGSEKIIGFTFILFIYLLFSWALGRFINKHHKKIESNELQNLLSGAWILGLIVAFFVIYSYLG